MLKNCDNFRDMGGIRTRDGHVIKEGKIIRSGKLSELTDRETAFLGEYGVRDDVDFRTAAERKNEPDRIPDVVSYHFAPSFRKMTGREAVNPSGSRAAITMLMRMPLQTT